MLNIALLNQYWCLHASCLVSFLQPFDSLQCFLTSVHKSCLEGHCQIKNKAFVLFSTLIAWSKHRIDIKTNILTCTDGLSAILDTSRDISSSPYIQQHIKTGPPTGRSTNFGITFSRRGLPARNSMVHSVRTYTEMQIRCLRYAVFEELLSRLNIMCLQPKTLGKHTQSRSVSQ